MRAQGRTVTDVANALGLERTFVSRCLSGSRNFPPGLIPALADYLGVTAFSLLGPDDPKAALIELCRAYKVTPDDLKAAS